MAFIGYPSPTGMVDHQAAYPQPFMYPMTPQQPHAAGCYTMPPTPVSSASSSASSMPPVVASTMSTNDAAAALQIMQRSPVTHRTQPVAQFASAQPSNPTYTYPYYVQPQQVQPQQPQHIQHVPSAFTQPSYQQQHHHQQQHQPQLLVQQAYHAQPQQPQLLQQPQQMQQMQQLHMQPAYQQQQPQQPQQLQQQQMYLPQQSQHFLPLQSQHYYQLHMQKLEHAAVQYNDVTPPLSTTSLQAPVNLFQQQRPPVAHAANRLPSPAPSGSSVASESVRRSLSPAASFADQGPGVVNASRVRKASSSTKNRKAARPNPIYLDNEVPVIKYAKPTQHSKFVIGSITTELDARFFFAECMEGRIHLNACRLDRDAPTEVEAGQIYVFQSEERPSTDGDAQPAPATKADSKTKSSLKRWTDTLQWNSRKYWHLKNILKYRQTMPHPDFPTDPKQNIIKPDGLTKMIICGTDKYSHLRAVHYFYDTSRKSK